MHAFSGFWIHLLVCLAPGSSMKHKRKQACSLNQMYWHVPPGALSNSAVKQLSLILMKLSIRTENAFLPFSCCQLTTDKGYLAFPSPWSILFAPAKTPKKCTKFPHHKLLQKRHQVSLSYSGRWRRSRLICRIHWEWMLPPATWSVLINVLGNQRRTMLLPPCPICCVTVMYGSRDFKMGKIENRIFSPPTVDQGTFCFQTDSDYSSF